MSAGLCSSPPHSSPRSTTAFSQEQQPPQINEKEDGPPSFSASPQPSSETYPTNTAIRVHLASSATNSPTAATMCKPQKLKPTTTTTSTTTSKAHPTPASPSFLNCRQTPTTTTNAASSGATTILSIISASSSQEPSPEQKPVDDVVTGTPTSRGSTNSTKAARFSHDPYTLPPATFTPVVTPAVLNRLPQAPQGLLASLASPMSSQPDASYHHPNLRLAHIGSNASLNHINSLATINASSVSSINTTPTMMSSMMASPTCPTFVTRPPALVTSAAAFGQSATRTSEGSEESSKSNGLSEDDVEEVLNCATESFASILLNELDLCTSPSAAAAHQNRQNRTPKSRDSTGFDRGAGGNSFQQGQSTSSSSVAPSSIALPPILRRVCKIVNTLTPTTMDDFTYELGTIVKSQPDLLPAVLLFIFSKAVHKPHLCALYAKLCHELKDILSVDLHSLIDMRLMHLVSTLDSVPVTEGPASEKLRAKRLAGTVFLSYLCIEEVVCVQNVTAALYNMILRAYDMHHNVAEARFSVDCACQLLLVAGSFLDSCYFNYIDYVLYQLLTISACLDQKLNVMVSTLICSREESHWWYFQTSELPSY